MSFTIKKLVKRDGKVVDFDESKIVRAVFKSFEATGEPNFDLAKKISQKALEKAEQKIQGSDVLSVEQIQDIVEQVLVEEGQAKAAKSYILYRQKRTEIRKQKQQILQKELIDEVDKKFDLNALRVLCSRYLRKNEQGDIIESPKELFERVALHAVLPSLFYSSKVYQSQGEQNSEEEIDLKSFQGKLKIGRFILNEFHIEAIERLYIRFNKQGKMKIGIVEFLTMLEQGKFSEFEKEADDYFNLMAQRKFFPNTPALVNFGNYLGMGSACFVVPIEDSIEGIMASLTKSAIIFKSGGGVGYNFSKLRPEGDFVKSTGGVSSGPLSFMSLFDKMTDVIKQGGVRRGASMGILDIDHPDIEKFITAKKGNQALRNFNISVFIKPDFWEYYETRKPYPLKNPKNNEVIRYVDPQNLFSLIVYQAWESAEPGVIFGDRINEYNPLLKSLGQIRATNPCGELPLFEHESCNLGSINAWAFCKSKPTNGRQKDVEFDWVGFEETIKIATKFLDNVVDVNKYPLLEIEEMTLNMRKIGLGLMGLADVLYELEIPYNSISGLEFMEKIMEYLNYYSKQVSVELAEKRGRFPFYEKSFYTEGRLPFRGRGQEAGSLPFENQDTEKLNWEKLQDKIKQYGIRNAQTTTNAPTGSISMIAGCSSGIEPNFSLVFEKKVTVGSFYYVNSVFEKMMEREGLFDEDLIKEVSERSGSIQGISYIPGRLKAVFATAMDITAQDHIKALAAFQKWTDSSISKTINFPSSATMDDMREAYLLGYKLGCKGVTVFRDQSIQGVLQAGGRKEKEKEQEKLSFQSPTEIKKPKPEGELVSLEDVKAKGPIIYHDLGLGGQVPVMHSNGNENGDGNGGGNLCPKCHTGLIRVEGCKKCPKCGWGVCAG